MKIGYTYDVTQVNLLKESSPTNNILYCTSGIFLVKAFRVARLIIRACHKIFVGKKFTVSGQKLCNKRSSLFWKC